MLNGIEGKIEVGGDRIDNAMPSFDFLSEDEIAAVIAYVRTPWGNAGLRPDGMPDPDAAAVAAIRASPADATEVAGMRDSLLR